MVFVLSKTTKLRWSCYYEQLNQGFCIILSKQFYGMFLYFLTVAVHLILYCSVICSNRLCTVVCWVIKWRLLSQRGHLSCNNVEQNSMQSVENDGILYAVAAPGCVHHSMYLKMHSFQRTVRKVGCISPVVFDVQSVAVVSRCKIRLQIFFATCMKY